MSLDCDSLSASTNRSGFDQSVHTFARNISSVEIQADHAAHAGFWILLELSFFGIQRLRYRKFNRPNRNVPRTHLNDIKQRFDDFLTLSSVLNLREFLSGWFLGIASGKNTLLLQRPMQAINPMQWCCALLCEYSSSVALL